MYLVVFLLFVTTKMAAASPFDGHMCVSTPFASCTPPKCPLTANCLDVYWDEFPPYAYEIDGKINGVIPKILPHIMKECCANCWKLNLTKVVDTENQMDGEMFFPSYWDGVGDTYKDMYHVKLVSNPSFVFVTKQPETSGIPRKLMSAIWNSWPVLVFAILLSIHAGVVIWFLEFWRNEEQFPSSFVKGGAEGFWWAFVSMTTVGYGDRAPQSVLGRGFAIFWILIGICICSIFTATLTTNLTTITLEEKKELSRAKVGAYKDALSTVIGVENQAKVIEFETTEDLLNALSNDNVEGILVDALMSAMPFYHELLAKRDFKVSQTLSSTKWSYGIFVKDGNFAECLTTSFRSLKPNFVSDLLVSEIESEVNRVNEATAKSSSIFDPTGDIFWPTLYTCIAFTVIFIMLGVLWEFVILPRFVRKTCPSKTALQDRLKMPDINTMESEMIAEVQGVFAKWRQNMKEIGIEQEPGIIELS